MPRKNCLIAGPTNAGKTILSCRLVEQRGYSRIPGDALVLAFQEAFPDIGIGHDIAGMSDEEARDSTCWHFGRFLARFLNALTWDSNLPYVVDTFHVRPADLTGLDMGKTTVVFLGYPEADASAKAMQTRAFQTERYGMLHDWVAGDISAVAGQFETFIRMSRDLRAQCAVHGFHFVDTGDSFADAIERAMVVATSEER